MSETTLLEAQSLSKWYDDRRRRLGEPARRLQAVHDLSFAIRRRGSLALVGGSGSGKTTTARMIVALEIPSSGTIRYDGRRLPTRPSSAERRARARQIQIVFQNPYLSLDPRQTARAAVEEVVGFHQRLPHRESRVRADELLRSVGLGENEATAHPRQLSGGQAQRVAIAKALAAAPQLLILDEAVSALDVSVQAQILNLLADLRDRLGLAMLFISHDLAVIRQMSDHVLVMHGGRAVEHGTVEEVLSSPLHPYTQRLLASVPHPGAAWTPSPAREEASTGCRYRNHCRHAFARCESEPALVNAAAGRQVRCWLFDQDATAAP